MHDAAVTVDDVRRRFREMRHALAKELPDHEIMRRLQGADLSVVTAERHDPDPLPGKYAQAIGQAIVVAGKLAAREQIKASSVAEAQATA